MAAGVVLATAVIPVPMALRTLMLPRRPHPRNLPHRPIASNAVSNTDGSAQVMCRPVFLFSGSKIRIDSPRWLGPGSMSSLRPLRLTIAGHKIEDRCGCRFVRGNSLRKPGPASRPATHELASPASIPGHPACAGPINAWRLPGTTASDFALPKHQQRRTAHSRTVHGRKLAPGGIESELQKPRILSRRLHSAGHTERFCRNPVIIPGASMPTGCHPGSEKQLS
jgi:hypothetical protein